MKCFPVNDDNTSICTPRLAVASIIYVAGATVVSVIPAEPMHR